MSYKVYIVFHCYGDWEEHNEFTNIYSTRQLAEEHIKRFGNPFDDWIMEVEVRDELQS